MPRSDCVIGPLTVPPGMVGSRPHSVPQRRGDAGAAPIPHHGSASAFSLQHPPNPRLGDPAPPPQPVFRLYFTCFSRVDRGRHGGAAVLEFTPGMRQGNERRFRGRADGNGPAAPVARSGETPPQPVFRLYFTRFEVPAVADEGPISRCSASSHCSRSCGDRGRRGPGPAASSLIHAQTALIRPQFFQGEKGSAWRSLRAARKAMSLVTDN